MSQASGLPPSLGEPMARTYRARGCEICGVPYRPTYAKQRTCSRTCGVELRRAAGNLGNGGLSQRGSRRVWPTCKVTYGDCAVCGAAFVKRNGRQKFCGDVCTRGNKRGKDRAYNRTRPKRTRPPRKQHVRFIAGCCRRCETQFVALDWGSTPDAYCSKRCQHAAEKARYNRKRRAAKLGAATTTERIDLTDIARRDRYRCGICGCKVDMATQYPDPQSPSLDHVVPLARGGEHTRANTQLAHFLCNSIKRDCGSPQQLMLI